MLILHSSKNGKLSLILMDQSLIPLQGITTRDFVLPDGGMLTTQLPEAAEIDATFLKTWLHGKSEKTQRAYLSDIHKLYAHTGKPLQQLTLPDFHSFIDSLAGLKPSTTARATATVKSALSFGVKSGYLQINIGSIVKLPKLENKLAERILSESSIAKMLALETGKRNHAILVLLYRAGLRAAEQCDLQWRHLQLRDQAGQIAIYGKGSKTRFVLLNQETWEEVQALCKPDAAPHDYVFQSREKHLDELGQMSHRLDESMIHRIVRAAARRAGIKLDVSPHWMRHAHATHALERGAPITLVKETLGHSSAETTMKYTHVRPNASSSQYIGV
jgi:integrase/recombinase XerD